MKLRFTSCGVCGGNGDCPTKNKTPQYAQLSGTNVLLVAGIYLRCFEMSVVGCRRKVAELAALVCGAWLPRAR